MIQLYPRALGYTGMLGYTMGYTPRLLRLAGLWRRYSIPLRIYILQEQDGPVQSQSQKSKSRYDRRPVNQYVSVPSPLGIKRVPFQRISIRHQEKYIKAKLFYVMIGMYCVTSI
jgi:hypothetical protein